MKKRSPIILTYDRVEGGTVGELFGDNKALTNNSHQ